MATDTVELKITGMDCAGCAEAVVGYLQGDTGITDVRVDWHRGTAEVSYDPEVTTVDRLIHSRAFSGRFCAQVMGPDAALKGVHHAGDVCSEAL
jgi:copper chaperone CopZ